MRTVLITGFEPFGGEARNSSQEIAAALHGRVIANRIIFGARLPCVFGESMMELKRQIRRHRPELVIALGQAGGRTDITPERVAINIDDARIPDNAGAQPLDRPIVRGGPAAYWSTLPIKDVVAAVRERGVPASVSQTAGTFVCNHVFYGLMHTFRQRAGRAARLRPGVRAGFIHVPFLPEQAKYTEPSLPLETMVDAIAIAVEVSLRARRALRISGGQVH